MSGKMVLSLACRIVIWFAIINFGCVFQAKCDLHVGPWGGHGGDMWTYEPKGDISHITITYDDVIHSICFTSTDANGNLDKSKFPCKQAAKTAEIEIDVKTEKLNSISGTFDTIDKTLDLGAVQVFNDRCSKTITSLSFTTNSNKTYGPFGTARGTAFSLGVKDEGFNGFYGSTGWLLDGIGVTLSTPPTGTTEDVGPWGGPGGHKQYDYKPTGMISRIALKYELGIHSIIFTSEDENGVTNTSRLIGDQGGWGEYEVVLDVKNGERLTGISGTTGDYLGFFMIKSLKFYTNKGNTFGPYGGEDGTPFSYMGQNSYISGFFGHDGSWIDSMGIHVQALPVPTLTFDEWGNINAGNAWTYEPKDGISHISITYGDAIYSIDFTSPVANTKMPTRKFGKGSSNEKLAQIDIDPKTEKLSGISGTVGAKKGWEVITSLTFVTDNNKTFGPFGTETGTAFSLPLKDGFISGFHGRSEKWLEAIGVYVKPI